MTEVVILEFWTIFGCMMSMSNNFSTGGIEINLLKSYTLHYL